MKNSKGTEPERQSEWMHTPTENLNGDNKRYIEALP